MVYFLPLTRSSDYSTEHPETETYYHHDGNNESSHDRRRIQSLEPKSGSNGNYSTRHNALPFVKKPLVMHQESFKGFNATNDNDNLCPLQGPPGTNCADLRRRGVTKSGIYYILIKGTTYWFMKVYCDMETADGGWTVSCESRSSQRQKEKKSGPGW